MQEPLFIAAAINGAYVLPLKVMLASLKEYLASTYRPVLYLLNRSLSPEQLESISLLVETHSIVPSDDQTKMLARQRGFPTEAAFPLLLPDLLPESVERLLFLDADILVLDDVAKIWEADISGSSVAAVADQAIPICSSPRGVKNRSALGIPDAAPYFNAGVMVLNLARWRRLGVASRAHEYLRQLDGQADFLHQEALNAVLWNDWLPLDQRWNLVASLTGRHTVRIGARRGRRRASFIFRDVSNPGECTSAVPSPLLTTSTSRDSAPAHFAETGRSQRRSPVSTTVICETISTAASARCGIVE